MITGVIENRREEVVWEMCARSKDMKTQNTHQAPRRQGECGVRSTSHAEDGGYMKMSTHGWRGNISETTGAGIMLRYHTWRAGACCCSSVHCVQSRTRGDDVMTKIASKMKSNNEHKRSDNCTPTEWTCKGYFKAWDDLRTGLVHLVRTGGRVGRARC